MSEQKMPEGMAETIDQANAVNDAVAAQSAQIQAGQREEWARDLLRNAALRGAQVENENMILKRQRDEAREVAPQRPQFAAGVETDVQRVVRELMEIRIQIAPTMNYQRINNAAALIESLAAKVAELFEEVAALTEERDWYSTANERAERAEAALAECRSKLEADPRTKYDGIDCRDETIRMLESKLAEREAELGRYMIANNTLSERAERAEAELAKRRIDVRVVDTAEQAAMKAELANVKEHAATLAMELSLLLDFVRDYRGCKFFAANAALEAYRADEEAK